jgi:hypothetical protein
MATTLPGFRPTLWSPNIIVKTDETLVFAGLVNRDYQGLITGKGNIVKINEVGDVTINTYAENEDMTFQTLTGANRDLVIDQAKYFAITVDDVLKAQADANLMAAAAKKAGESIGSTVDKFIAAKYPEAGIVTSGLGTAGTSLTVYATHLTAASNLLGMFSNILRYLDEAEVPASGRFMVIPPWLHSYLNYAQLVDNTNKGGMKTPNSQAYGNGYIGSIMGIDLYVSNNVSNNGTQYRCMFGNRMAISFAGQITSIKAGDVEKQMGEYIKGLYVYGAKVVRPDQLGVAYLAAGGLST